jgi:hypothetical protein
MYFWYRPEKGSVSRIFAAECDGARMAVFCTDVTETADPATAQRALLVGTSVHDDAQQDVLTSDEGTLTEAGQEYCKTWGVQPDAGSLRKWAETQARLHHLSYELPN